MVIQMDGTGPRIDDVDLEGLRAAFRGQLLRPRDGGYDEARRIWNGAKNQNIKPN